MHPELPMTDEEIEIYLAKGIYPEIRPGNLGSHESMGHLLESF